MSPDIPLVSLRDAGVKVIDCVHKTPEAIESGFPYVAIPQMVEGRLDLKAARRISERDMQAWNVKCDPKEGDVVLSRRCNPGVTAVIPKGFKGSLGQNLVLLRATNGRITPEYLRWATRGREWWNEVDRYINVGAVFESLRCADIPEFQIPLPSLPEQKAIAHILGTLDDKIELNRKTNGTLEAMAKALFKSWFVDFDPVRAKAEGRPTGLPDEISDLFPDSFEDSELGEIPSGWKISSIYDVSSVIYGAPFSSSLFNSNGEGVPVARIRDLPTEAPAVFTTEIHPKGTLIKPSDIVVGMDGEFRAYLWGGSECWMNQRVCQFVPKANNHSCFVMESIRKPLMEVEMSETATTVIHLGKGDIDGFKIVIPSPTILDLFGVKTKPLLDSIVRNKKESRSLTQLRDALLPKLISGEIRIPDAERLLEEAGV